MGPIRRKIAIIVTVISLGLIIALAILADLPSYLDLLGLTVLAVAWLIFFRISSSPSLDQKRSFMPKGNTLRVYITTLKQGPCELKDVQHSLDFSTPSLASYHLNKLIERGYVKQDEHGRYFAVKDLSNELLQGYSKIGRTFIPQLVFVAILYSILVGYFSFRALEDPDEVFYLVVVAVSAMFVLWLELIRLWQKF